MNVPLAGETILLGRYMSIIIALTDIGPGDGATVLVPGSMRTLLFHWRVVLQTLMTYRRIPRCVCAQVTSR